MHASGRDGRSRWPQQTPASLTAILPHGTRNTTSLTDIDLTSTLLGTSLSTTAAAINDAFLDIRGEREEGLFYIDV